VSTEIVSPAARPPGSFNVIMTSPRLAAPAVALLEGAGCTIHYMPPYPSADAVAELTEAMQADAILTRQGPVNEAAMAASPRLRIVARHGVGVDDVDLQAAAARGIIVARAPGSNSQAVAEHTLAVILALAKDLLALSASIADGAWRGGATKVRDVAGLRLGLVGFGNTGQAVARLAPTFGMRVAVLGGTADVSRFPGVSRAASLDALLATSDVLSLHCPLTPETYHLIDATALARMPQGAYVINTARGGIVDEAALEAAIDAGHIAGAALDVFETEPPPADHPLRRHPRVIRTPHVSGVTDGALINMGVMAAECIVAALTGGTVPPERVVR
jgi:D-3-phosphoglycerate dehydrogenase